MHTLPCSDTYKLKLEGSPGTGRSPGSGCQSSAQGSPDIELKDTDCFAAELHTHNSSRSTGCTQVVPRNTFVLILAPTPTKPVLSSVARTLRCEHTGTYVESYFQALAHCLWLFLAHEEGTVLYAQSNLATGTA